MTVTATDISVQGPAPAGRDVLAARSRILTRPLVVVLVSSFGAMSSFYLLLSVVPLYVTSAGGGRIAAGLVTGVLMLTTVAAELATPRLVARFGSRLTFAAGLVLLGAPALLLAASGSLATVLAVCAVRGLGLAIVVVVGGALVASLVPPGRRGEGLGLYGLVVGVPAMVALPLGVWLAENVGYPVVFVAGAGVALVGLAVVAGLPGREPAPEEPAGVLAGFRSPALVRPAVVFATTAMTAGIVVAFLPLAVTDASGNLAALALLGQAVSTTVTRWLAGRYGDRHGPAGLLIPGVLTAAGGMLALVSTASPVAVLAGMVMFGAGFGATQTASLTVMLDRVPASGYGTVSAMWNLAYDAALGLGAAGFGVLAAQSGYRVGFLVTAVVMLLAIAPAWRDRTVAAGVGPDELGGVALVRP